MTFLFFLQNIGLGAGLAMDASAVSMSNGLNEPKMSVGKKILMAGVYALFQAAMPIAGYFAGHALLQYIEPYIPWIALLLLAFLGGKMIRDGIKEQKKKKSEQEEREALDYQARSEPESNGATGSQENADEETKSVGAAEAQRGQVADEWRKKLGIKTLLVQAVATSIDALSVGLSISDYTIAEAMIAVSIIAAMTFGLCMIAVYIGQKFGDRLGSKAVILGGVILIAIGIEICLTGLFG